MQEKSILNVLLHVRAEIIRDGLVGLEHVDALLRARGFDPASQAVPRKIPRYFPGRGKQRQAILAVIRESPGTSRDIAERIARKQPGSDAGAILGSVSVGLTMLKRAGVVRREGRLWRLS